MTDVFAITSRGLEHVSAAEIERHSDVAVLEQGYRRVIARCGASLEPLLGLRTVDDVFVLLDTWTPVTHHRSALEAIRVAASRLDVASAVNSIRALRPLPDRPRFSVTASFVGKRNYSGDEIKQALASGLAATTGWHYSSDDATADLNVRIFVEHELALLGLRIGRTPLHERPYKVAHRPGSLKPPVAAALLALGQVNIGHHLLDPCCGVGTIAIEAGLRGAEVLAGDQEPEALAAARANAAAAGIALVPRRWDVRQLPLAEGTVDRIVTNLPWGRQIAVGADLAAFYRRTSRELRRVLSPGGSMVLLTGTPDLVELDGLRREQQFEISLFGQNPTIMVLGRDH